VQIKTRQRLKRRQLQRKKLKRRTQKRRSHKRRSQMRRIVLIHKCLELQEKIAKMTSALKK
jgi:hypothetical protein